MSNEIILDGIEYINGDARNILYDAARGTAFPYDKFVRALRCDLRPLDKFDRIKSQWPRKYSHTLRRDFITTASEALNGTVKRYALGKSQVRLVKAFLQQGMRAYKECCEKSAKLKDNDLMPLANVIVMRTWKCQNLSSGCREAMNLISFMKRYRSHM